MNNVTLTTVYEEDYYLKSFNVDIPSFLGKFFFKLFPSEHGPNLSRHSFSVFGNKYLQIYQAGERYGLRGGSKQIGLTTSEVYIPAGSRPLFLYKGEIYKVLETACRLPPQIPGSIIIKWEKATEQDANG